MQNGWVNAVTDDQDGVAREPSWDEVSQWLYRATIDVISTTGFRTVQVAQIVTAAGLSRGPFYRRFSGKHDALLAASRQVLDRLVDAVQRALDAHRFAEVPVDRTTAGLTALAEGLAEDPAAAVVLFREAPVLGEAGRALRGALIVLLVETIGDLGSDAGLRRRGWPVEGVAGGVYEVLHRRAVRGDAGDLPGLVPDLVAALRFPGV